MHSVKQSGKPATASFLWQKCLQFVAKKPFTILNAYVSALFSNSFSFDPSLWWLLLLSMAARKGHTQFPTARLAFRNSRNNAPQHITMFLDSTIAASWHLPVCCNRELTEQVLELLVMVYTDDLKEGVTHLIHESKVRVAS